MDDEPEDQNMLRKLRKNLDNPEINDLTEKQQVSNNKKMVTYLSQLAYHISFHVHSIFDEIIRTNML